MNHEALFSYFAQVCKAYEHDIFMANLHKDNAVKESQDKDERIAELENRVAKLEHENDTLLDERMQSCESA